MNPFYVCQLQTAKPAARRARPGRLFIAAPVAATVLAIFFAATGAIPASAATSVTATAAPAKLAVNSQRAITPRAVVNLGLSITQAKAVQVWLDYYGYNAGTADGQLGPNSWMAFQRELKQYWGYSGNIDGIVGSLTVEALQRLLVQWGYPSNEIDGIPGPKTQAAFARFANYLISTGY